MRKRGRKSIMIFHRVLLAMISSGDVSKIFVLRQSFDRFLRLTLASEEAYSFPAANSPGPSS
jgi:hypothetical protein